MSRTLSKCPVCHNHIGRYVQRFHDTGETYFICECSNPECLFCFLNPQDSVDEIAPLEGQHITKQFTLPEAEKIAQEIKNNSFLVKLVQTWAKEGGNVVEIGPGYGYSLAALKKAGYVVYGVEVPSARSQVVETKSGVSVVDSIDKLDASVSVDAFVIWHLLEHITDPVGFLSGIHKFLNEETYLFIQVPSFENLDFYYENLALYNSIFSRVHVNYFTQYSLTMLLRDTGFVIADMAVDKVNNFITVIAKPGKSSLIDSN